jgi:hypothetical protein
VGLVRDETIKMDGLTVHFENKCTSRTWSMEYARENTRSQRKNNNTFRCVSVFFTRCI